MNKILIFAITFIFLIPFSANSQKDSLKTALILVDIQDFYFAGGKSELVKPIPASENAKKVLKYFRKNKKTIIHIQHNYKPGIEIHKNVSPLKSEKVIVKDHINSFRGTDLLEYLNKKEIKNLVICGMQTHMCVEAVTRAAADYGFKCTVINDACATKDLKFKDKTVSAEDVHYSTLSTLKNYATITSTQTFIKQ